MFSPHYGQSYYEIFSLGNSSGVVKFTSLHNQPSLRRMLTADFPVGRAKMRFAYIWDAQQSQRERYKDTHLLARIHGGFREGGVFIEEQEKEGDRSGKMINQEMTRW